MAKVRIFSPPKSSMQSGHGRTEGWVIQFAPTESKRIDPLTGWYGSGDTEGQVDLHFPTAESAVAYAEARGLSYDLETRRQVPAIKPKSYAENFRTDRPENWTH